MTNFWNKTKDLILSIFSTKKDSKKKRKLTLADFVEGQSVEIKLIPSLEQIGVIDPGNVMPKRYDPEDYQTKKIRGFVTGTRTVSYVDVVEICSVKIKNGIKSFRHYSIMLDEIENVKVLS